jgi:hypothetical protein
MSKLGLFMLTGIFVTSGVEFAQVATAAQTRPLEIAPIAATANLTKNVPQIALGKGCSVRRYRRPR